MKTTYFFGIAFIIIALVLGLVIANINPSIAAAQSTVASLSLQITPTPIPIQGGNSVIGSTDGIMLMGVIISLIVIVPVLFRRKKN
jgi:preprotein translocase subunit SecG